MENSARQFFFLESERRECVWGHNDGDFSANDKIKYKHADYLYTYHWKPTTNESNAGHIRSLVRQPNVSSQFYTFSCLYLLEKKCTRLKTAVWFFALCAKRSFLSRSVKTIDGSPCWISKSSTNFFLSWLEIVNRPLATSCEILVASAKFLVALATGKVQFRTLTLHLSSYEMNGINS